MSEIRSFSAVLALGAVLAAAPHAALALGSTPVTVVNPTTSPVPSTIVNPTTSPVPTTDVNNPALQPFQANLFPHSSTSNESVDTFFVPAGKRLVIEYYSSQPQDTSGAAGLVLTTTVSGNTVSYIVYVNATTSDARNQQTRIYADPGSTVEAFAFNNGTGVHSSAATITVSGYLVTVP